VIRWLSCLGYTRSASSKDALRALVRAFIHADWTTATLKWPQRNETTTVVAEYGRSLSVLGAWRLDQYSGLVSGPVVSSYQHCRPCVQWKCVHGVAPEYLQEVCVAVENVWGRPQSASIGCSLSSRPECRHQADCGVVHSVFPQYGLNSSSNGNTGASRARVWRHMVSAKREPITEVWGQSPQRGSVAESEEHCMMWTRFALSQPDGSANLSWNLFFSKQKISTDVGGEEPWPPWIRRWTAIDLAF